MRTLVYASFLATAAVATALPLGFKPNIIFNLADDFGHYNRYIPLRKTS